MNGRRLLTRYSSRTQARIRESLMMSPIIALAWSIWRRGRVAAFCVMACLVSGVLLNLLTLAGYGRRDSIEPVFGILMALSFMLLMGIFNYSEFNPTREWNGFPYRLFVLPVRTWQLVALPVFLCVATVEVLYYAWIKLVWAHTDISRPGWLAIVLGAYAVSYQATLWTLAGMRVIRIVALALGGISSVAMAFLPFYGQFVSSPWFDERRLIPPVIGAAVGALLVAWAAVARQRCGGGRRQNWTRTLAEKIVDALPRRTREFASPSSAQFWFEWRRIGWLLPVCTLTVLVFIFAPVTVWGKWGSLDVLSRLLTVPIILAFAIGKNFVQPEFWTTQLSLPSFTAVRPLPAGEFVIAKMKVAALSVLLSWGVTLGFIALWLPLSADKLKLRESLYGFTQLYPHSWPIITALLLAALMVVSFRCMVSGMWIGLRGSRFYAYVCVSLQLIVPLILLIVVAINSVKIDKYTNNDPSFLITLAGWILWIAVLCKFAFAVFTWSKISPRRVWQYMLIWSGIAAGFIVLGSLSPSEMTDTYRLEHLIILGAFLICPLARLGLAPQSLSANRHGAAVSLQRPAKMPVAFAFVIIATAAVLAMDRGRLPFKFVDAGGHTVRMLIQGHGGPAVIFETGARGSGGAPLEMWSKVQPRVSQFTTTVSYDRAGVGLSAPGPEPRDARQIAIELHTALKNAGIAPPYILAGHSFGGPFIRVFAGMYPADVCGLVLIDPTQEEAVKRMEIEEHGHKDIPEDDWQLIQAGLSEAHNSPVPPKIPVTLITAIGPKVLPDFMPEKDQRKYREGHKMWLKFHQDWVDRVPSARHVITENSGHGVPFFEPELVTSSIRQVFDEARPQKSKDDGNH